MLVLGTRNLAASPGCVQIICRPSPTQAAAINQPLAVLTHFPAAEPAPRTRVCASVCVRCVCVCMVDPSGLHKVSVQAGPLPPAYFGTNQASHSGSRETTLTLEISYFDHPGHPQP